MRLGRVVVLALLLGASTRLGAQSGAGDASVSAWLYPAGPAIVRVPSESAMALRLPRSSRTFTRAQVTDFFAPPDWYPRSHPAPPAIVAVGRKPAVFACGYCHLPAGGGRPENAALAGLPADYMVRQVADIRSGARRNPLAAPYGPWDNMHKVAVAATDDEVRIAAEYFASLRLPRRVRVVEGARVPRTYVAGVLRVISPDGGSEPIAGRIIEVAEDHERFERRDERSGFIAYVPAGSVARGRAMARRGVGGAAACASCHGPALRGGATAPPIAGQFPSYLMRQLVAFRSGARASAESAPMRAMAAGLSDAEMVALAAYVGSIGPRAGATR